MAFDYDTIFTLFEDDMYNAWGFGFNVRTDADFAENQYHAGFKDSALHNIIHAGQNAGNAWDAYITSSGLDFPWMSITALFESLNERLVELEEAAPGELTLFKMVNAMLDGVPTDIEMFVGITDAFRQSIWNRPFNKQLYANLARSFETWL